MQTYWETGSGVASVQSTHPQTVGYGLSDSPAGLFAWIANRFWSLSDHDGDLEKVISRDRLLDIVTTDWLSATGASAPRLHWESYNKLPMDYVHVPVGCSIFPRNAWIPRAWCEERFTDLRYWKDLDAGGHFPAMEQPDALVTELRTFFRTLRG